MDSADFAQNRKEYDTARFKKENSIQQEEANLIADSGILRAQRDFEEQMRSQFEGEKHEV